MTGGDPTAKSVKVKVDSARWWPNGLKVDGVDRTIKIDTSIASVDSAADSTARVARVGQRRVTIMTAPMPATRDAQFGKPDALVAQRVLLGQCAWNAGSSRTASKSESCRAISRPPSHISIARRRCSIAASVSPARLSQQAVL